MDYITIRSPRKNVSHSCKNKKMCEHANSIQNAFLKSLCYKMAVITIEVSNPDIIVFNIGFLCRERNQISFKIQCIGNIGGNISNFFKFCMRVHFTRIKDIKGDLFLFICIGLLMSDSLSCNTHL